MTAAAPALLALVRSEDLAPHLPAADDGGGWSALLAESWEQALGPLLHRAIRSPGLGGRVPAAALDTLAARARQVAARNLLLGRELGDLLAALGERGVGAAPLRGPALAERLWGDAGLRPMGDLDLLVRRQDLDQIVEVGRALGYREMDRRPGFARAFSYALKLLKDRHGWVIVEPHWSLAYPPFADRLDMEAVWARVERGRVLGVPVPLLPRAEEVFHLALHLVHREADAPLLWVAELDRLIRLGGQPDWDRVLDLGRQSGTAGLLLAALARQVAVAGTPVPAGVLDALARAPAPALEGRLARFLGGRSSVDGKESLAQLLTIRGTRARLGFAAGILFPSADFMRLEYRVSGPAALGWAYARRLAAFSREGARGLIRLLR